MMSFQEARRSYQAICNFIIRTCFAFCGGTVGMNRADTSPLSKMTEPEKFNLNPQKLRLERRNKTTLAVRRFNSERSAKDIWESAILSAVGVLTCVLA